jgi:hypothetical protein
MLGRTHSMALEHTIIYVETKRRRRRPSKNKKIDTA